MTEVLDPPEVQPMSAALGVTAEGLRAVIDLPVWPLPDCELMDSVAELHRLRCVADAAMLRLVREIDSRGAAVSQGAASTVQWLRSGLRLHPGEAKRTVALASVLYADPAGALATFDEDVQTDATEAGGEAEPDAKNATHNGPPHGVFAETRVALREGAISTEHARVVASAVSALPAQLDASAMQRGEAFMVDYARDHDPQFVAKLGQRLLHTLDPNCGDRLANDEAGQVETRELWVVPKRGGGYAVKGELDVELGNALLTALAPYSAPRPAADAGRDLRTAGRRNADALEDVIRLATSHPDAATVVGSKPNVVVTLDLATLTRQSGAAGATLDWGGVLSAEAARRLACDARVIPVVLGADGQPLDVGRACYTTTLAIRRALTVRDQGCAFPGCDRPPGWSDAHHIVHWADGGSTSVDNMVLLCGVHHRVVHHDDWVVRIAGNGLPEFIPPRWIDPSRTPRSRPWRAELAALAISRTSVQTQSYQASEHPSSVARGREKTGDVLTC